jgi:hypothetical protein
MTEEEFIKRRFAGYQLHMLTLDETGAAYAWALPHPQNVSPSPVWWGAQGLYETGPFQPYNLPNMSTPVLV